MASDPMGPTDSSSPRRRRRPFLRRGTLGVLAVGLVVGIVGALTAVTATSSSGRAESCEQPGQVLRVVVVPEMAEAVSRIVQRGVAGATGCPLPVAVISSDAAATATAIRDHNSDVPDVWIPDSSAWTADLGADVRLPADTPSLASSPLTLAVPQAVAASVRPKEGALSMARLLPSAPNTAGPVQWILADPDHSIGTVGAVLGLEASVKGRPDANALIGTVLRAARRDATSFDSSDTQPLALPLSEQQVYRNNNTAGGDPLVAAYPPAGGFRFDYPYVSLASDQVKRDEASDLLELLQGETARGIFDEAGFRSPTGAAGPLLAKAQGINGSAELSGAVPDRRSVSAATVAYSRVVAPSRLLAVIDVSGSMGTPVPGAHGASRLDLAVQASMGGLAVYPDDAAIGLWVFTTDLTRKTDYRQLVPLTGLGRGADGISGRERVAVALGKVHVEKGRTGLYDTVLAAVREVRRTWDPNRVNSVVVITDGGDSDRHSIGLQGLLHQLRKENDPSRPVAVFAIAYGPSGDVATLSKISAATGGRAYAAPDPRMINQVLADAIGRRACSPSC